MNEQKMIIEYAISVLQSSIWIAVEEGLPENENEVLITAKSKLDDSLEIAISSYTEAIFGGQKLGYKEWSKPWEYFHSNYEVIAWMPLPEPYKC